MVPVQVSSCQHSHYGRVEIDWELHDGLKTAFEFYVGFEANAHFTLMKALLTDAFNTPKGHPKVNPS